MADKKINYTENDRAIVNALKGASDGMTLAEINEATGLNLQAGHIVSAKRKGLIEATGDRIVSKPSKRQVATYTFVTSDTQKRENGKDYDYTEGEQAILKAAATIDGSFTLADLAKVMGVEKIASGQTNSLTNKGNLAKGEPVDVPCMTKSKVKVYAFVADIPEAE